MDRSLIIHPKFRPADLPDIRLARWLVSHGSDVEEQFRVLATRIRRPGDGRDVPGQVIAVTSAVAGEGKTLNSINLAASLARDFHRRVLLLEGDFKHPVLGRIYSSRPGLRDHLAAGAPLEECLCGTDVDGLTVLMSGMGRGAPTDRSTQFLGSPDLHRLVLRLRERFDFVIVDGPPLLPLADMRLIEEWSDHLLLVVRAAGTDRSVVKRALEGIDRKKFLGVVLNAATGLPRSYGYGVAY